MVRLLVCITLFCSIAEMFRESSISPICVNFLDPYSLLNSLIFRHIETNHQVLEDPGK